MLILGLRSTTLQCVAQPYGLERLSHMFVRSDEVSGLYVAKRDRSINARFIRFALRSDPPLLRLGTIRAKEKLLLELNRGADDIAKLFAHPLNNEDLAGRQLNDDVL